MAQADEVRDLDTLRASPRRLALLARALRAGESDAEAAEPLAGKLAALLRSPNGPTPCSPLIPRP
jgi:hypothetical protein